MDLHENDLNHRVVCSWQPAPKVDPLFEACADTFDWALQERFEGSVPTLSDIRARFVHLWQRSWGDKPKVGPDYWKGPKTAIGFGTKTYKFMLHYGCLKPMEEYTIGFGVGTITGTSAIIEEPKGRYHPQHSFALDIRVIQPKILYTPDYRGFSRWLGMQLQSDAKLGLLHVPMLLGKEWSEMELDRNKVDKWLQTIMKQAAELPTYPVAGAHCKNCPAPCKEVFCGPNDHFRKGRIAEVPSV